MEWLDELATTLGVPPLTDAQAEALLAVSREVAHGVERKATPLAAFLAGRAVERGARIPDTMATLRAAIP